MVKNPSRKPDWVQFTKSHPKRLLELMRNMELSQLLSKSDRKYLSWDDFQYQKMPEGIQTDEAWCCLMLKRTDARQILPVKSNNEHYFSLRLTPEHHRQLSQIDSWTSGIIASHGPLPQEREKNQLLLNGLMEEAITSSQLEGASTLKDVAKRMLLSQKEPQNEDQRMILNNYIAVTQVEKWKDEELTEHLIKKIHQIVTQHLLPGDESGQYRQEQHDITVSNPITGKIYHRPKAASLIKKEIQNLCHFANMDDEDNAIHPVVKAIILHFWIGYLHPFTDGNGRTARIIFYWYLVKKEYWLLKYIPISDVIKKSKQSYLKAYLNSNQEDELDLGYFIQYILRSVLLGIENFKQYLRKKRAREDRIRAKLEYLGHFNDRQIGIVNTLKKYGNALDIKTHQMKFQLSYEVARKDFLGLEEKGILKKMKRGKKFIYTLKKSIKIV